VHSEGIRFRDSTDRSIRFIQIAVAVRFLLLLAAAAAAQFARISPNWPLAVVELLSAAALLLAAFGVHGLTPEAAPVRSRVLVAVLIYWIVLDLTAAILNLMGEPNPVISVLAGVLFSPFLRLASYGGAIIAATMVALHINNRFGTTLIRTRTLQLLIGGAIVIVALLALSMAGQRFMANSSPPYGILIFLLMIVSLAYMVLVLFWEVWVFFELGAIRARIRCIGACSRCGYPLGTSPTCTECGACLSSQSATVA